jgi:hypothetical protein
MLLQPPPDELQEPSRVVLKLDEEEVALRIGFDTPPRSTTPLGACSLELPHSSSEDEWQFPTSADKDQMAVLLEDWEQPESPGRADAHSTAAAAEEPIQRVEQPLRLLASSSSAAAAAEEKPAAPHEQSRRQLARQLTIKMASCSRQVVRQRQRVSSEEVLMLLVEAFGRLKGCNVRQGQISEEQLQSWLGQLLQLTASGENDTVLALHGALKQEHSWLSLGDVFSALVYLRDNSGLAGQ